jgi:hypothetical protein
VPLVKAAELIGQRPFMEYALSYALYNYKRKDPAGGLNYDNLDLIRAFSGYPDEYGFILVHVAMVRHSGALTAAALGALDGAAEGDRSKFVKAMEDMLAAYQVINQTMETMWGRSKPEGYMSYRTVSNEVEEVEFGNVTLPCSHPMLPCSHAPMLPCSHAPRSHSPLPPPLTPSTSWARATSPCSPTA